MERFGEIVRENGGEMEFADFVAAAAAANLQPRQWLQAKHAGIIKTEIREGVHYVSLGDNAAQPQAGRK